MNNIVNKHLYVFTIALFLIFNTEVTADAVQSDSTRILPITEVQADKNEDGKLDYLGQTVTTAGRANVASSVFNVQSKTAFIQDDSAGILLFFPNSSHKSIKVNRGDSLVVTGKLKMYYGKAEIVVEKHEILKTDAPLPAALPLKSIYGSPEKYLGMLTKGEAIIVGKTIDSGYKRLTISPSDESDRSLAIYISRTHAHFNDFNWEMLSTGDRIHITGVVDKYTFQQSGNTIYEVLPRSPEDISYAGLPRRYLNMLLLAGGILLLLIGGWTLTLRKRVNDKTSEISEALEEKELLLKEIHHRVKNNLSIISGLIGLQMDTTDDHNAQKVLEDSQSRIQSMAMIHDKLYQTESLSSIRLDNYLKELVEAIHQTFSGVDDSVQINFDLEPAEIDIDKVVPCGLLVNELVVNSFKHAFKPSKEGILEIKLKKQDEQAELTIADNGPGLPENFLDGSNSSLGAMLIQTFADQLEAERKIRNPEEGCIFNFRFSLR